MTSAKVPRLRPAVYLVGAGLLLALGVGLWQLDRFPGLLVSMSGLSELHFTTEEPQPGPLPQLPDSFKPQPLVYGTPTPPKERPPVATPLLRSTPPPPPVQAAALDSLPSFLQPAPSTQTPLVQAPTPSVPPAPQPAQQPLQPQQAAQAPKDKPVDPRTKAWKFLVNPTTEAKPLDPEKVVAVARLAEEQAIIKNAKWAIPAKPLVTIYKSMELIGTLHRSVNSDIPGIVQCKLSVPLFDKFGYGTPILDKGTIAILKQESKLEYGSRRVPIKLDQLEPPSGEVIIAKGAVEDAEGKTGLPGKVNNHLLQLGGAVLINAFLSLGTQSVAGTPGRGQFFENPAQQAARDVSQSTSQDIRKITDAQLKVPPTIEIDAGTPCLVQLDDNITFSKKAVVVP